MSRLFQPTFKASSISAPNVPGADIGAFGKAITDMRLRDAQMRQLDLENKRAEEKAEWERQDRAQVEDTREFLKGYNYDPKKDTTLIDRNVLTALSDKTTQDVENVFKSEGVSDYNALSEEGKRAVDSIGQRATSAMGQAPRLQSDVHGQVYTDVLRATGDPTTAEAFAKNISGRFLSQKDLKDAEKEMVKSYNEDIDKQQQHIYTEARLNKQRLKSGKSDKKNYIADYSDLQSKDYDVSLIDSFGLFDAGRVQDIIKQGRANRIPAWAVDKAIKNTINRSATGDNLIGSNDDIVTLANYYYRQDATGGTSDIDLPRLKRATVRDLGTMMRDSVLSSYGVTPNRLTSSGSSGGTSNGGLGGLYAGGGNTGGTGTGTGNASSDPQEILPPKDNTPANKGQTKELTPTEQFIIEKNRDKLSEKGSSVFNLTPSRETLDRRDRVRKERMGTLLNFLRGDEGDKVANLNDIRMRIARNQPITENEYEAILSSLPPELQSPAKNLIVQ